MDKKALMDKLALEAYEKGCFNGAWLYAENGEIISKGAYGWVDAEDTLPMREDTVFEMASITKMFTATAVMLLLRDGKLSLDDEYSKYFPDYPYPEVKIRHLLTHTSGMPEDFETADWVAPVWENEHRIPPCSEIIRFIRESGEELDCAPGERFEYSDVNYCLLALLVEKLSGENFEGYLKKNVLEPAGMKDSAILHTRRDGRHSDRIARNMVIEDGKYVPSDLSKYNAGYVVGSDGLNGCDYLYTTIFDMLAWDRALREEKVLTREEQTTMFTPVKLNSGEVYEDDDGEGYGFGWCVVNDEDHGLIVSHSGGMPGLNTWFEHFVDDDRALVMLFCREVPDDRVGSGVWDGFMAVAHDEEPEPIVSIEDVAVKDPDKSGWEELCGEYERQDDTRRIYEVRMTDGELFVKFVNSMGIHYDLRLYPLIEGGFGIKEGDDVFEFGDGCLMLDDITCKKL